MASFKVLLQPAYVLHQRAYRDTSGLLELFTPAYGRIGVVARGMKTSKSAWRGVLQPFQPLLVSWNLRKELGTLTAAEAKGSALALAPEFIASGFYINEVIMRLVDRQEGQLELFGVYDATLRGMAEITTEAEDKWSRLEVLLRKFEMQLLSALGYGLVLDQDVISGLPVQPDKQYVYCVEHGPELVMINSSGKTTEAAFCISGETLIGLSNADFSAEKVRTESKRLLRNVLSYYLGPRPLKSRDIVQTISRVHSV